VAAGPERAGAGERSETIDIKALAQRRESPAFLQDELLRRLKSEDERSGEDPLHVFVIIGSPMDFYSFRDLPHLPPGSEEKCVVYYLQFELLNTLYANGAVGNVQDAQSAAGAGVQGALAGEHTARAGADAGRSGELVRGFFVFPGLKAPDCLCPNAALKGRSSTTGAEAQLYLKHLRPG
jgi:hypothetical protein